MKYKTVTVTARRGDHGPYRYVAEQKVRAGRAGRVARRVAREIAEHEGRGGSPTSIREFPTGAVVTVEIDCRFVIRAG